MKFISIGDIAVNVNSIDTIKYLRSLEGDAEYRVEMGEESIVGLINSGDVAMITGTIIPSSDYSIVVVDVDSGETEKSESVIGIVVDGKYNTPIPILAMEGYSPSIYYEDQDESIAVLLHWPTGRVSSPDEAFNSMDEFIDYLPTIRKERKEREERKKERAAKNRTEETGK